MPKVTHTPAPHPAQGDKYTLTVDGTAGNFTLGVKTAATGPLGGVDTTNVAAQNFNVAAGTLQTVLEAMAGLDDVVVTGGPGSSGGGTPYFIEVNSPSGQLVLVSEAVTGGGGTVTLTQTQVGQQIAPAPAGVGVPTFREDSTATQFGSPSTHAPAADPAGVSSRVAAAASANAINTTTEPSAKHLGHTPDKADWPPSNQ